MAPLRILDVLQGGQGVGRDEGPEFLAVAIAEGVQHAIVGAGEDDRRVVVFIRRVGEIVADVFILRGVFGVVENHWLGM